jgi:hypothetical protein
MLVIKQIFLDLVFCFQQGLFHPNTFQIIVQWGQDFAVNWLCDQA